jgi:hypothetical protein
MDVSSDAADHGSLDVHMLHQSVSTSRAVVGLPTDGYTTCVDLSVNVRDDQSLHGCLAFHLAISG